MCYWTKAVPTRGAGTRLRMTQGRRSGMPAKTFSIMGDSISTFEGCVPDGYTLFYNDERLERSGVLRPEDTWWSHTVRALGGTVLADSAWSGSMVEGAGFPAGRSHAMPRCIDPATVPEQIAGAAPADAVERFGAAYRTMLRNIRTAAPKAAVYCITLLPGRTHGVDHPEFCYRLRGRHLDEYNAAIRDAAAAEGCRVADVRAFGRDYDSLEGTHPTNLGMRQFASMVVRAMQLADSAGVETPTTEGITAVAQPDAANPALDLRDFCGAPKSAQLCDSPTCIGCPHAANTGNQWLCRCLK